jgi:hypothetical protein
VQLARVWMRALEALALAGDESREPVAVDGRAR